jgi:hypothetical protein
VSLSDIDSHSGFPTELLIIWIDGPVEPNLHELIQAQDELYGKLWKAFINEAFRSSNLQPPTSFKLRFASEKAGKIIPQVEFFANRAT